MASTSNGPSRPKGPPKPCVITFFTHSDKMSEPPPQPRMRKVMTVISTLAIVVRDSESEFGLWVLTSCEEKTIPKTSQLKNFRLGSWIMVGIYPDGSFASVSPLRLDVQAYETVVQANVVFLRMKSADLSAAQSISFEEFLKNNLKAPMTVADSIGIDKSALCADFLQIPGFGLILAHRTTHHFTSQNPDYYVWIQWTGEATKGCCWTVNSFNKNMHDDGFTDQELKECGDIMRNREISDVGYRKTEQGHVARHYGLITDINQKKSFHCWSNHGAVEGDHFARIAHSSKQKEKDDTAPLHLIGQWIQFDIDEKHQDAFMFSKTGTKLNISGYLPVTSPNGVGVVHAHKTVRLVLSCCLVKSTSHPLLFDLGDYGFAIDRSSGLVSGLYMQLVLEKLISKYRRSCGATWKVVSAAVVQLCDVTEEVLARLPVAEVPNRDAMELSTVAQVTEKANAAPFVPKQGHPPPSPPTTSSAPGTGITTLKYQPPPTQQQVHYQEPPRRDYYSGTSVQMTPMVQQQLPNQQDQRHGGGNFYKKKYLSYVNASLEGHALVEKISTHLQTGILWMFDAKISARDPSAEQHDLSKGSIHFIYNSNELDQLDMGDYAHVKLVQKQDDSTKAGFRWKFLSGTRKSPPCQIEIFKNQIVAHDTLVYGGVDKMRRTFFKSKLFPNVLDLHGFVQDPHVKRDSCEKRCTSILQAIASMHASLTRKMVQTANPEKSMFQWVLCNSPTQISYQKNYIAPPPPVVFSRGSRQYSLQPVSASTDIGKKTSDHSSAPIKGTAL